MPTPAQLPFTPDDDANRLLARDPLALLIGMLLDQQFPMERAFLSPSILAAAPRRRPPRRRGARRRWTPRCSPPCSRARPRCTASPARWPRAPRSCAGTSSSTTTATPPRSGRAPPTAPSSTAGCGPCPASARPRPRIFVKVLGRQLGVAPAGWEEHAATWASIADVDTYADIATIRSAKQAAKAAAKAARRAGVRPAGGEAARRAAKAKAEGQGARRGGRSR